jgi:uncharacterized protein YbjT (DUF2867 family)
MIGGHALQLSLDHPLVSSVTVVGRRTVDVTHAKLSEVLHDDFSDCTDIREALTGQDIALYCIGVYTGSVPADRFREITVDYTVAFADVLHAQSPQAAFCFLSGGGADQSETSRMAFARHKGAAEKALLAQGFARMHIFRPGYIYPVIPRDEPNISYRVSRTLYPVLRRVLPNQVITSENLARAMLHAGLYGTGEHKEPILENRDIRALAQTARDARSLLRKVSERSSR